MPTPACAVAEGELLALDEQNAAAAQPPGRAAGRGGRTAHCRSPPPPSSSIAPSGLPAEISADLLGRRPDVVAARSGTEAQARRIDQKKAEFYPNVNLSALVGVQPLVQVFEIRK